MTSDLKVVERYIGSAQKSIESGDTRNARRSIGSAQNKLQQTALRKKRYFSSDHPEYIALQKRIDTLDIAISESEMANRFKIFGSLSADREAYRKSGLGDNASDELKRVVRDVDYALKSFQESTIRMAELKIKEAGRQIDYITKWLNNEAKKADSNELPNAMNKMTFKSARLDLDGATRLMGGNDERIMILENRYQDALDLDAKLAKIRVEQTRMIPDNFTGSALIVLKKKAEFEDPILEKNVQK